MKYAVSIWSLGLALLTGVIPTAHADDWAVLVDNNDSYTLTSARALVAPRTSENRLTIRRLRMTRSGTTAFVHTFVASVTEDAPGDTENLTGCVSPGCKQVLVIPGVMQKEVIDLDGLNLILPPNARLYYMADQNAGTSRVTIEVFYSESH
jgi:hypothetical protein